MCGTSVGTGSFLTLDDFEIGGATIPSTIDLSWKAQDGRNGAWHQYSDTAAPATMQLGPTGGGGSPDSLRALHFTAPPGVFSATLGLPLGGPVATPTAGCYDASAYDGISFWIKGNPAAGNTQVKFNVQSPVSEPVLTGGACMGNCYDHFSVLVPITTAWTRVKVPWSDLKRQRCLTTAPATAPNFQPQKQIVALSFEQADRTKNIDYWVDDITFDIETRPATNFGEIVTQPIFNEIFKFQMPLPVFTYAGLVAAVAAQGQGALAQTGTPLDRKHEAAALLAQISQETGGLTVVRESACSPVMTPQCTTFGLPEQNYYGRGAIQLTHQANYDAANAVFPGISANPDLVAQMTSIAYGTAVWFWMTRGPHQAMAGPVPNFGATTRAINGGIECGGGPINPLGASARAALYKSSAAALGVNVGGQLLCP